MANLLAVFTFVCAGVLFVGLAGGFLLRLFGQDFRDGVSVLKVLLAAAIPEALAVAVYQVIQSRERMWTSLLFVSIPRDLLLVAIAYSIADRLGAIGIAYAYLGAWCLALMVIVAIAFCLPGRIRPARCA
jgi:O-antigen/teichoic acid export membrane protein